jgi:hypothetical protein
MQLARFPLAVKAALVLALTENVNAFWRMPCRSRSGLARMDPLVSPGEVSGHVHAIHGSSGKILFQFPISRQYTAAQSQWCLSIFFNSTC